MRTSIKALRRRELIDATRSVIAERGFEAATISQIAKEAGFSVGFIHHHFKSKDVLLAETMRYIYSEIRQLIVSDLRERQDPYDRLQAMLRGNFSGEIFTKENAYVWVSFLPRVPFNTEFQRIQRMIERRQRSNLMAELKQLLPEERAAQAARHIGVIIDGHWVCLGLDQDDASILRERALEHLDTVIAGFLAPESGYAPNMRHVPVMD